MDWLSRITGNTGTTLTTTIAGKEVGVYCSPRAGKELARRKAPLFVEIELAFACIARKAVHFHESARPAEVIMLNDHLALQVTTCLPESGQDATAHAPLTQPGLRHFLPKWVRIDYSKGGWRGDYGF